MTEKVDFKSLDAYQARVGEVRTLDVPPLQYLAIDGHGDPNSSEEYAGALAALYPVAYTLKFASRRELGRDYVVMPLEGLWWADDMAAFTVARDKSRWSWTLLIMTPDWVDDAMRARAVAQVAAKGDPPQRLVDLRLQRLTEGRCVQTLHVGPYDDEGPVLARLHDEVLPAQGLRPTGRHHEIYLSDPRRTAPERLRTILRQPVTTAATNA
jgi:hypothetical protein